VREIIKLGESLLDAAAPAESYSIGESDQNIRGGGYEVVGVAKRAVGGASVGQAPSAKAASLMVGPRPVGTRGCAKLFLPSLRRVGALLLEMCVDADPPLLWNAVTRGLPLIVSGLRNACVRQLVLVQIIQRGSLAFKNEGTPRPHFLFLTRTSYFKKLFLGPETMHGLIKLSLGHRDHHLSPEISLMLVSEL
jgi:hypothetical protein